MTRRVSGSWAFIETFGVRRSGAFGERGADYDTITQQRAPVPSTAWSESRCAFGDDAFS